MPCKVRTHYHSEELGLVETLFRRNASDEQIASALNKTYGRTVQAEGVRKIRRKLKLRKVRLAEGRYLFGPSRYYKD